MLKQIPVFFLQNMFPVVLVMQKLWMASVLCMTYQNVFMLTNRSQQVRAPESSSKNIQKLFGQHVHRKMICFVCQVELTVIFLWLFQAEGCLRFSFIQAHTPGWMWFFMNQRSKNCREQTLLWNMTSLCRTMSSQASVIGRETCTAITMRVWGLKTKPW